MNISVLVPVYNEELFIEPLFKALANQKDISRENMEIIVVDGNSTDDTLQKLRELDEKNSEFNLKILHNPKRYISSALNIGLKESSGKYIIRIDVHSTISKDYISRIYNQLAEHSTEYCNFGGRTNAKGYDEKSIIVSKALSSRWVLGGAHFRFSKKRMEVDTLFPGAWLREDLLKVGGWNEHWLINEDVELNCRLRKITNKKIIMDPTIVVDYFPRNKLKKLAKQYFNYGYWRIKTAVKHEESIRVPHLVPLFSLLTLLSFLLLAVIDMKAAIALLLSMAFFYSLYLVILASRIFEKKEILIGIAAIFIIQFTWILGAFKGYLIFGIPLKGYYLLFKRIIAGEQKVDSKRFSWNK
ncbi:glycosyltransferase family 2 protein [Metaplanococcus flavidus]